MRKNEKITLIFTRIPDKVYMDTCKPAYAIRLSAKNFSFEDNKKIVPLYAAFCI